MTHKKTRSLYPSQLFSQFLHAKKEERITPKLVELNDQKQQLVKILINATPKQSRKIQKKLEDIDREMKKIIDQNNGGKTMKKKSYKRKTSKK